MRNFEMSWESRGRWVKMYQGVRYRVTCEELGAAPTQEGSYRLANEWWRNKRRELDADGNRIWFNRAGPEGATEPVLLKSPPCPASDLPGTVAAFLKILSLTLRPVSYKDIQDFLATVCGWWTKVSLTDIDENSIEDMFGRIAAYPDWGMQAKKKRWNIFRRWVLYLVESGKIVPPRNLHSRMFKFKVVPRPIKTYTDSEVKGALAAMTPRFRCWAMLGLNTGMTNIDIASLTKDMVTGNYLTRRRVKTGDNQAVPTVKYLLWASTLQLMNSCQSSHNTLWFTTQNGSKLVTNRLEDGYVKTKDMICHQWRKKGYAVPLKAFRSIAATLLDTHPVYGRYVGYFLGHTPQSIKDRHYAAPSQEVFDAAMIWLGGQVET